MAVSQLLVIARQLDAAGKKIDSKSFKKVGDATTRAANSFCGSWIGYHSRIYYEGMAPTPAGAHFSAEWGLMDTMVQYSSGRWVEQTNEAILHQIDVWSGKVKRTKLYQSAGKAGAVFEQGQARLLSYLSPHLSAHPTDSFLKDLVEKIKKEKLWTSSEVERGIAPSKFSTRDMLAGHQGIMVPPHVHILAELTAWKHSFDLCSKLAKDARLLADHLKNLSPSPRKSVASGVRVFIGHGRSPLWRTLKDLLQDRLGLPCEEFNRVSAAGIGTTARLSEMLNGASAAFLGLTAEDEQADGKLRPRMNVVHEAGLFQGRLGFERAILLVEEGCEEFSNVHGLGQIRFPRGNISHAFEEVRHLLEREKLIAPTKPLK